MVPIEVPGVFGSYSLCTDGNKMITMVGLETVNEDTFWQKYK